MRVLGRAERGRCVPGLRRARKVDGGDGGGGPDLRRARAPGPVTRGGPAFASARMPRRDAYAGAGAGAGAARIRPCEPPHCAGCARPARTGRGRGPRPPAPRVLPAPTARLGAQSSGTCTLCRAGLSAAARGWASKPPRIALIKTRFNAIIKTHFNALIKTHFNALIKTHFNAIIKTPCDARARFGLEQAIQVSCGRSSEAISLCDSYNQSRVILPMLRFFSTFNPNPRPRALRPRPKALGPNRSAMRGGVPSRTPRSPDAFLPTRSPPRIPLLACGHAYISCARARMYVCEGEERGGRLSRFPSRRRGRGGGAGCGRASAARRSPPGSPCPSRRATPAPGGPGRRIRVRSEPHPSDTQAC